MRAFFIFSKNHSKGSVLVWVLWSVAVLSLLVIHLTGSIRQDAVIFKNILAAAETRAIAEAGVKATIQKIKRLVPGSYYDFAKGEEWAEAVAGLGYGLGEGRFELICPGAADGGGDANSSDQNLTDLNSYNHSQTSCDIMDAGQRVSINRADRGLLTRLFLRAAGLKKEAAVELAGAVADYRDADDAVSGAAGRGGSEKSVYRFKKVTYAPKNADFETETELLRVPGMTAEIYRAVRPWITVHGDGRVNLNTAPAEVIALSEWGDELTAKVLSFRSGPDGVWRTADDGVFGTLEEVEPALAHRYDLSENQRVALRHAITRHKISVGSEVFLFSIKATTARGQAVTHVAYHLRTGVSHWNEN
jgi:type II secretory pathway component PulK